MPSTPTVPGLPWSRRAAMATVALAPLAACTADDRPLTRRRRERPEVDPDVAVAAAALAGHRRVLDQVRATQRRHRDLDRLLEPVALAHEAHVEVLAEAVPPEATSAPRGTPPSPLPSEPAAVPRDARRALTRLVQAEQALSTATKRHAFGVQSGAFARVLGSMAAAAAQHAVVLETLPARTAGRRR